MAFDAHHLWLGISPQSQPPNHYRLLGLDPYDSNQQAIAEANERVTSHLRRFQLGSRRETAEKLLNEVGEAYACLSDPQSKAAYDQLLAQELEPQRAAEPARWTISALVGSAAGLAVAAIVLLIGAVLSPDEQAAATDRSQQPDMPVETPETTNREAAAMVEGTSTSSPPPQTPVELSPTRKPSAPEVAPQGLPIDGAPSEPAKKNEAPSPSPLVVATPPSPPETGELAVPSKTSASIGKPPIASLTDLTPQEFIVGAPDGAIRHAKDSPLPSESTIAGAELVLRVPSFPPRAFVSYDLDEEYAELSGTVEGHDLQGSSTRLKVRIDAGNANDTLWQSQWLHRPHQKESFVIDISAAQSLTISVERDGADPNGYAKLSGLTLTRKPRR